MNHLATQRPTFLKRQPTSLDRVAEQVLSHFKGNLRGKRIAIWGNTENQLCASSKLRTIQLANLLSGQDVEIVCHFEHKMISIWKQRVEFVPNKLEAIRNAHALVVLTDSTDYQGISWDPGRLNWLMESVVIFDVANCLDEAGLRFGSTIYYGGDTGSK